MASWSTSPRKASGDQEICALTCYFNPEKFRSKRENFYIFSDSLERQGVDLFVIELAFADEPYELSPHKLAANQHIFRVRAKNILWQKERLLNRLLAEIPKCYAKVVWLDCDLIFEEDDWLDATAQALEWHALVQPFTTAIRLPAGQTRYHGDGDLHWSFGSVYVENPEALRSGVFNEHGHTGFAWAARRDWLACCGLYECCLSGSGDHLMAHAFCGDWESACVTRLLHPPCSYYDHFQTWAARAFELVRGDIGVVEGSLLHLWHGRRKDRGYLQRNRELAKFDYDPTRDIRENADGCLEFTAANPPLKAWAEQYFPQRKEDASDR